MMAKKLLSPSKLKNSVDPSASTTKKKTVAPKIHTSKKVSKVKRVQKSAKPLNKPVYGKTVKG